LTTAPPGSHKAHRSPGHGSVRPSAAKWSTHVWGWIWLTVQVSAPRCARASGGARISVRAST